MPCSRQVITCLLLTVKIRVGRKPKAAGVSYAVSVGKLSLIDLAGSERASRTKVGMHSGFITYTYRIVAID